MRKKQRLVVCLDGTWNKRDDSTNVLHHFGMTLKGEPPSANGTVTQVKYYDEGVGTGVIDSITGGGFGFGLEENVRQAYDWLVEKYHDGADPNDADEIYIFGFSRGAYTARSLVGFISTCGLIKRGAPLSVNQLWEAYCVLGREREHRSGIWDRIFGQSPANIRRITGLICDPWKTERYEAQRARMGTGTSGSGSERVPGQLVDDLNPAEALLVRWSRRVRITYLGVYDTVGAVGIDALAIPGLKSKLAMHHNMRATTLVQHCRHALAIDEHRTSFSHTPFLEYVGHGLDEDDVQSTALQRIETDAEGDAAVEEKARKYWERKSAMWRRKIEQRWFVGAHSNIGGGYPDNVLAQRPFEWLLEGAREAGLESERFAYVPPGELPTPRDSYAEFAKPFWTQIIRGKRYYRPMDPAPEIRASSAKVKKGEPMPAGFSLNSINETIDDTVFDVFQANQKYRPPNLFEFATGKLQGIPPPEDADRLQTIAAEKPKHSWIGSSLIAHLTLVLWATGASIGLLGLNDLFAILKNSPVPPAILYVAAFIFAVTDWAESRANFALAIAPPLATGTARRRAFLDSIYWTRTLGFLLFAVGTVTGVCFLWSLGWRAGNLAEAWTELRYILAAYWPIPVCAAAGVVVAVVLDRAEKTRAKLGVSGALAGAIVAFLAAAGFVICGWLCARILTPLIGSTHSEHKMAADEAQLAGLLLLLQLAYFYFLKALSWTGEPMGRVNLGSIVALQLRCTPGGVARTLENWRQMLVCEWSGEDDDKQNGPAARTMRQSVREALWRDIFGYVPVCFAVLAYGLWFAHSKLKWEWLGQEFIPHVPLWVLLPAVAALADYCEDFCHLRYLKLHERKAAPPIALTLTSFVMTMTKFAAFVSGAVLTIAALTWGSINIAQNEEHVGWRGTVALLLSTVTAFALVAILLAAILYRMRTGRLRAARKVAEPNRDRLIHGTGPGTG